MLILGDFWQFYSVQGKHRHNSKAKIAENYLKAIFAFLLWRLLRRML